MRSLWFSIALVLLMVSCGGSGCTAAKRKLVSWFTPEYEAPGDPSKMRPVYEGADAERERIIIDLHTVAEGLDSPTDVQFFPNGMTMVVLQKAGAAAIILPDGAQRTWFTIDVVTDSEAGLLGLAFHPNFEKNGFFYINSVVERDGTNYSQVMEWQADVTRPAGATPRANRLILELAQPYSNHNAGQLAFGPDGYLYIGWGDGGWRDDPHGNGQDPATWLGSMLRIDVDTQSDGKAYTVPPDNPFLDTEGVRPETWAYGLRNPWRYSFDAAGRLIVADVGQNKWEELDLVEKGGNFGWGIREGRHCFEPEEGCRTRGLIEPFYEYGREEGQSITGGYVYAANDFPQLEGKYIFADFVSGRVWAVAPPEDNPPGAPLREAYTLGRWPLLISTFGRDQRGRVYAADFAGGKVYRIAQPQ